jgi:thiosulfate/3-mercaptopyruvate sulfurtransferase
MTARDRTRRRTTDRGASAARPADPDGPLVSTAWLNEHLDDADLVLLEVDEQPLIYNVGHIPGARNVEWRRDLQADLTRDIPGPEQIRELWRALGITRTSRVVIYGDRNNWYACFAYWLFALYGLDRLALLDGGRQLWLTENRPTTTKLPAACTVADPAVPRLDEGSRATWRSVLDAGRETVLLDVRTSAEFTGDLLTEPGYPQEAAQRPGHIPGARSAPWNQATNPNGTFLGHQALAELYAGHGIDPDRPVITYCRIGERSAHTWFVLHELLGVGGAQNYDGSWTEWGSMIGMPVENGETGSAEPHTL